MDHEIITAWAGVGIGVGQLLLIAWGLRQMGKASQERNRQLDAMEAAQREQSHTQAEVLGRVGEGIAELLRRTA